MNKLVACAVLGLCLTQALVACGDDDVSDDDGTSGSSGTAGKGGSASGGGGGKASGGSGAGKAGSGGGGTTNIGGSDSAGAGGDENGVGGDVTGGGSGGDTGAGGADSMGGAGGAPPVEPVIASEYWLSEFCAAKSLEERGCTAAQEWSVCFGLNRPYLEAVAEGYCGEEVDPWPKAKAVTAALNNLATSCRDPDVEDWRCTVSGAAEAKEQACREADEALFAAKEACALVP
jgi:hypothetical protein